MGVVGRTAGTAESFLGHYSEAMKSAGAAGLVWDEANLAEYLRAPRLKVPGNKMAFGGLTNDDDIANVIAYLKADPEALSKRQAARPHRLLAWQQVSPLSNSASAPLGADCFPAQKFNGS